MVKRGWDAHVLGEAPNKFTSAVEAVKKLRVGGWIATAVGAEVQGGG
jgi:hypothetical protein